MAKFKSPRRRIDPYKNFRFRLRMDGRVVAGIAKASNLKRTSGSLEREENTDPPNAGKSFEPELAAISLERGVTFDSEFEHWASQARQALAPQLRNETEITRKDLVLEVYDEAGRIAMSYKIRDCWISEFQSLADLDANMNAVAIQSMRLEHGGLEQKEP